MVRDHTYGKCKCKAHFFITKGCVNIQIKLNIIQLDRKLVQIVLDK